MSVTIGRILSSKWTKRLAFLLCLVPIGMLVWKGFHGDLTANPVEYIEHTTGDWTIYFILITLSITPLRKLAPSINLIRLRRMTGLYAFFYGFLHFFTYGLFDQMFNWMSITMDVYKRPFITVGFLGFVLMIPLALTSTARMVRRLGGKRWQMLHRLIYVTATAGVVHYYWLVKSDITLPVRYGAILAFLLIVRAAFWLKGRQAKAARTPVKEPQEAAPVT
jgi:sulfoxide reductase heme-binding subunit YedZ